LPFIMRQAITPMTTTSTMKMTVSVKTMRAD
jgi:hypothetical protein